MDKVRVVTVTPDNVEREGFFCYKSKKKSEGYTRKMAWLQDRLAEGMVIKILYEGKRSVAFIEYTPGEHAWRAVEAAGYLLIHCLWVVGKGKGKGYSTRLLGECLEDARARGAHGVAMVTSRGNWLADDRILRRHGYAHADSAPPSFDLMVKRLGDVPSPAFPTDWSERASAYGEGATIVYADQCPYMPDAVSQARMAFQERGVAVNVVQYQTAEALRAESPSAYGTFGIVLDGELFCTHYLGKRELKRLDEALAQRLE